MGFVLASSFPKAPFITADGNCRKSKQYAKNYDASSYVTTLWHNTGEIQKEYPVMMSVRQNLKLHHKVTNGGSRCKERERKYVMNATSTGQSNEEQKNIWVSVKDALNVFFKFIRPTATFPLVLGATLKCLIAVEKLSDLSPAYFIGWLQVVVISIFMQIFMAGLNQLYDVEIDKINKPYLPLVSGELSFKNGVIIVASSLILGFLFAWSTGSWPLLWTFCISSVFAAAYSADLPLLRWKKSPILTAVNYISDLAVAKPIGYFLHMQTHVFKRPAIFPRPLIFGIAILSIFSTVIALFKDIPDMEGDEKFGIKSLSLRLGRNRVFWICVSLLEMAYGVAILVGATSPFLWSKIFTGLGHGILASVLWYQAKSVDRKSNAALQSFYTFIWKLLTVEYFLIPLFR